MLDDVTKTDIENTYASLVVDHENHLKVHGVRIPPLKIRDDKYNNRALLLVCLRLCLKQPVHKDALAGFVHRFNPEASGDQQARHLAYDGWDVRLTGKARDQFNGKAVPRGCNILASVEAPKTVFMHNRLKRLGHVASTDWQALLESHAHRCAACGILAPGRLEKGHMDPGRPLEMGNIIPLCSQCNNWASDRVVLDAAGRVVALASPDLVKASSDEVQFEVYRMLRVRFGKMHH